MRFSGTGTSPIDSAESMTASQANFRAVTGYPPRIFDSVTFDELVVTISTYE
jgi:hypothetical protein